MKAYLKKLTFTVALATAVSAQSADKITVKGSDTMVILAQKWAEVYMGKNPGTKIQVTGGGSGVGLAALQNKATDIANASRPIRPAEIAECIKNFGKRPREYRVALDGLTVYVNESNPINELSLEQLERIFTGKAKNWKEFGGPNGPIRIYSRENSSGTYEFFKEHVLLGADFASSAQTMQGTAALMQAVAKDKTAIGYGGTAYGAGAKALKVKKTENSPAIAPTEENVVSGAYPIWRYLNCYIDPALDKGAINKYLTWMRTDEGQKVVKDVGYFPLPEKLREKGT